MVTLGATVLGILVFFMLHIVFDVSTFWSAFWGVVVALFGPAITIGGRNRNGG